MNTNTKSWPSFGPFALAGFFGLSALAACTSQETSGEVQTTNLPVEETEVAQLPPQPVDSVPAVSGIIDLAICLDTSGSMDGLIDSAKQIRAIERRSREVLTPRRKR